MPGWSETPHGNPNVSHLYAALFGDLNLCTTIGQLCIRAFIVHSCSSISESNTIGDKATTIIIFPWALKHVRHPSVHIYPSLLTVVIRVVIIGLPFWFGGFCSTVNSWNWIISCSNGCCKSKWSSSEMSEDMSCYLFLVTIEHWWAHLHVSQRRSSSLIGWIESKTVMMSNDWLQCDTSSDGLSVGSMTQRRYTHEYCGWTSLPPCLMLHPAYVY